MKDRLVFAVAVLCGKFSAAFLSRTITQPQSPLMLPSQATTTAMSATQRRNPGGKEKSFLDNQFVGDDDDDWYNTPFNDNDDGGDEPFLRPPTPPQSSTTRQYRDQASPAPGNQNLAPNNNPQPSHFFSRKNLEDFAPEGTAEAAIFHQLCNGVNLMRPSKIQALVWPILRQGQSAIVAEQTGSGKTLAYLIPLLERLLSTPPVKAPGSPRVIILAPTAELADQTRAVCDKLAHGGEGGEGSPSLFNTLVITATGQYNTNIRDQIRKLQRTPVDILISTPGRLSTILRTRNSGLDLQYTHAIVLDEVDILLLDDTFGPQLRTIGQAAPVDQTQFVFCTATLPDTIVKTVQREFPNVQQIRGPGLHKVAPTVRERLIDVSVAAPHHRNPEFCFDVKSKQLLKALRETRCRRTLIFCNTVESCRMVENLLKRHDRQGQLYQVGAYHNALTPEARQSNLRALAQAPAGRDAVLVCTDRAARGVDFDGTAVDHVVVFDFPSDPAEYVRRVGRTARAGRTGTCTVLAYGWQLPIARSVMTKDALQEFKAADKKSESRASTSEGDSDDSWSLQQRRKQKKQKKDQNDIKESIETGRLWG